MADSMAFPDEYFIGQLEGLLLGVTSAQLDENDELIIQLHGGRLYNLLQIPDGFMLDELEFIHDSQTATPACTDSG